MKVLAVLIILVALVIAIVPQFTNCEANKDDSTAPMTSMGATPMASASAMASPMAGGAAAPAPTTPYRMMKCYWTAHGEIVVAVPLIAIGLLLLVARRKETTLALGVVTAVLGVLTILLPTSIIGTCLNDQMVCNTEMKPVLLIAGGITVALGVVVLVVGQLKREDGNGGAPPAGGSATPA